MLRRPWFVSIVVVTAAALGACFVESADDVAVESVEQNVFSPAVEELNNYVLEHACVNGADTDCLERLIAHACSQGCQRFGYNWRGEIPGRLDPHMTHEYLRKLRNAAASAPDEYPLWNVGFGVPMKDMLWHQVQMMLRFELAGRGQAWFYATSAGTSDGTIAPLTAGAVSTPGHTVDPTRFYAVAWVNTAGTAHAMAQADMGVWFQSVAKNFLAAGDVAQATYYLQLSERVFRTYGLRDNDGGVRNNKRSYRCFTPEGGQPLYCYWFHSFAIGEYATPSSVLNQNLHAIRDAMEAHNDLRTWASRPGVDAGYLAQLSEWARGGLFQLAYGTGNVVDNTAPPSLAEFEVVASDPDTACLSYGYAAYDYALGGSRKCIKPMNTCHYHYHSLSVMRRIIDLIELDTTFAADPLFIGAKFKLMYGRSEGDTRTCNNRSYIPPSRKVMNNVALARLFNGSATTPFNIYCDGDPWNDTDVHYDDDGNRIEKYNEADEWAHWSELRLWYETAYDDCTF